jgi:hypothetical protein
MRLWYTRIIQRLRAEIGMQSRVATGKETDLNGEPFGEIRVQLGGCIWQLAGYYPDLAKHARQVNEQNWLRQLISSWQPNQVRVTGHHLENLTHFASRRLE